MLRARCIGTGSNGNCIELFNGTTSLLLDAGVNWNTIRSDINLSKATHIFITHEHKDHCQALPQILKAYPKIKIVMSAGTWTTMSSIVFPKLLKYKNNIITDRVGPFWEMLSASHDTIDPVNFLINLPDKKNIGYITDTGKITKDHLRLLEVDNLHLFLEANYDKTIDLREIRSLRTMSDKGHLSVEQANNFLKLFDTKLKWFGFVHRSKLNNKTSEKDYLFYGWKKHWE